MSQRTVLLVHNNTQINNLIIFSNFFHFASTFPWNFLRIFVLHVHKMCKCRNCGNVAQFSRWYIKIHSGEGKSIWHSIMADGSRAFYSNKIKKIQWVYFFEFVEFIRLYVFILYKFSCFVSVLCVFCIIYILLWYILCIIQRIQIIVFTVSWAIMLSYKNTFASKIFSISILDLIETIVSRDIDICRLFLLYSLGAIKLAFGWIFCFCFCGFM